MSMQSQYIPGWLDTSIHDFLSDDEHRPSGMTFALVTCLDSSFKVAEMVNTSSAVKSLGRQIRRLGNGIIVRTESLVKCERRTQLFFGYDEVFFFPHMPHKPKPSSFSLVGPRRLTEQDSMRIVRWMEINDCALALGDGDGLNFIARVSGVARPLLAHFAAKATG